ncbi:hypothetical protein [Bradyrhizobium sp. URHC0002]
MKRPTSGADDLGLTEESREDYRKRVAFLFSEGCAIFGAKAAAKLFRAQAKAVPKATQRGKRPPPQKRRGPHDPEGDRYLLQLWNTARNGKTKRAFAKMALKNHAVKIGGKIRRQDKIQVDSMVRRLNRIIERAAKVRQLGARRLRT